ncbi:MAG: hypothetical protein Q8M09_05205 [Pseudomonadota bacterium]|nr:hypothetical protein [Pseudomonadota bacterium]MDP2353900.1 hypothetical protein [Pseudomonadota bacterium]
MLFSPPKAPAAAKKAVAATGKSAKSAGSRPPGTPVAGCPKAAPTPFKVRAGGDGNVDVFYLATDGKASREGVLGHASGEVSGGLLKMSHAGHFGGSSYFGGSHKLDVLAADAKISGGLVKGVGGTASAKAAFKAQEASVFVGKDANNPWLEAGGEYSLLQAEAKGDFLLGSDGRRAGLALGGKAVAATASADAKGEINIPIPFTNWTISARGKGGGTIGSAGAGGGAHAYKDLQSGRYHGGVWGEAAAFVGLNADLDLSIGPRYDNRERQTQP